jgi:hypothetical protein
MDITLNDEGSVAALIRGLAGRKGITVNIYYQVVGNITNSTVSGVNVMNAPAR